MFTLHYHILYDYLYNSLELMYHKYPLAEKNPILQYQTKLKLDLSKKHHHNMVHQMRLNYIQLEKQVYFMHSNSYNNSQHFLQLYSYEHYLLQDQYIEQFLNYLHCNNLRNPFNQQHRDIYSDLLGDYLFNHIHEYVRSLANYIPI